MKVKINKETVKTCANDICKTAAIYLAGPFLIALAVRIGWEGGKVLTDAGDAACERFAKKMYERKQKKELKKMQKETQKMKEDICEEEES